MCAAAAAAVFSLRFCSQWRRVKAERQGLVFSLGAALRARLVSSSGVGRIKSHYDIKSDATLQEHFDASAFLVFG